MIVEDETLTALLLKKQLEEYGFDVVKITATGEDAIEYVKDNPIDFIIMDITLSGVINGIDASKIILSTDIKPYIIYTTGYDGEDIRQKAMKTNPAGYLVKPYNIEDLVCIINEL
jgi:DNA-binding NarL/FixJ family response regulator